jgi:hypothetical protein
VPGEKTGGRRVSRDSGGSRHEGHAPPVSMGWRWNKGKGRNDRNYITVEKRYVHLRNRVVMFSPTSPTYFGVFFLL